MMRASPTARIIGTGMAVPDCVVDNRLLARCMNTTEEWIVQRTGIRQRHVSPDTYRMLLRLAEAPDKAAFVEEVRDHGLDGQIDSTMTVTDLALEASRIALKNAGVRAEDLDCLVESSTIPDFAYPHTGCVLQGRLGLTSTPVFNLQQGCAGFVYGLALADHLIRLGTYRRILVVGAELISSSLDYTDRGRDMGVLFADGAGAAVLQAEPPSSGPPRGLISHHLHADGTLMAGLQGELWGSSTFPTISKKKISDGRTQPRMNGRAVFTQAVRRLREVVRECLDANGLSASDVDLYLFHQANLRIIDAVVQAFDVPETRTLINVDRYGNTSAASIPICLHEAVIQGRLEAGHLVLLATFGTGFSWGSTLLRW